MSAQGSSTDLLDWLAGLGAASAAALARHDGCSERSARARLQAAERRRLVRRVRPLAARPSLYTATPAGLAACGRPGRATTTVTASNAEHALACCAVAAVLEQAYPGATVEGEPALRIADAAGRGVAARLGAGTGGDVHRPDLVLRSGGPPGVAVAVEVELTVKAPRRLRAICLAWARCRDVAGVIYVAADPVEPALRRALAAAGAEERVAVLPLRAIYRDGRPAA
jgi:hypothetical protein